MQYQSLFALLAVAVGSSTAQSTSVVSLYLQVGNPAPPYVGSVISVEPSATVYAVKCAPNANASQCNFPGVATIKQGPSTFEGHVNGVTTSSNTDVTVTITEKLDANCALTPSPAVAVCTNLLDFVYVIGTSTNSTTSSNVATSTNWSTGLAAVTITAGLDKLGAQGSNGPGGAPPATTSKPSAAGPRVTQQAVLAGAAAVVGAVIIL